MMCPTLLLPGILGKVVICYCMLFRSLQFTSTDVILARTDEDCVERDSAVALHTAADLDRTSHQNQVRRCLF